MIGNENNKDTFVLFFGNGGFFLSEAIAQARKEISSIVSKPFVIQGSVPIEIPLL